MSISNKVANKMGTDYSVPAATNRRRFRGSSGQSGLSPFFRNLLGGAHPRPA